VSYPLYLCHFAIIALLVAFLDRVHALSAGTLSILAFPLCILVAEGFRRSLPWALRVSKRGARTETDAGGQRPED
jgi:peptidoglycan/LPS O-acetylase OafA/YrhL